MAGVGDDSGVALGLDVGVVTPDWMGQKEDADGTVVALAVAVVLLMTLLIQTL